MPHRRLSRARIVQLREYTTCAGGAFTRGEVEALLGDRNYYRSRCTVELADVKAAGVTWPVVQAWAKTQPASLHGFDTPDWYAADQAINEGRQTVRLIIATCNLAATLAKAAGRDVCPLDVLEEMAALRLRPCPSPTKPNERAKQVSHES